MDDRLRVDWIGQNKHLSLFEGNACGMMLWVVPFSLVIYFISSKAKEWIARGLWWMFWVSTRKSAEQKFGLVIFGVGKNEQNLR